MKENKLLLGKKVAEQIYSNQIDEIRKLKLKDIVPQLAVLLIGENPASKIYVKSKTKIFKKYNCLTTTYKLEEESNTSEIVELIKELNGRHEIHGILVQLPLPKHLDTDLILNTIHPTKDVDGMNTLTVGKLFQAEAVDTLKLFFHTSNSAYNRCQILGVFIILQFFSSTFFLS